MQLDRGRQRVGGRAMPVIALVTALFLSACAAFGAGGFKEPVVTVREINVAGLGINGGSVDLVLSVYNPNGYKLDGVGLTYNVDVDSIKLGSGALDSRFVVNGNDSSLVRVPVQFTYAGIGAAGRSLLSSGTINYRVRGDVTVGTPIGNFTRPYDRRGQYSTLSGRR